MFNLRDRDGRKYATERDITNLYQFISREAAYSLTPETMDKALLDFARHVGLTNEDLCKAAVAARLFLEGVTYGHDPSVEAVFERSGFAALNPAARLAFLTALGKRTMEYFHVYTRMTQAHGDRAVGTDWTLAGMEADLAAMAGLAQVVVPSGVPFREGSGG